MYTIRKNTAIILILVGILGLIAIYNYYAYQRVYPYGPNTYQSPSKKEFSSNGEMIYYTGFNMNGDRIIPKSGGPHWLYQHGGSCVTCHGPDGKGGRAVMMCDEIPPDIRFSTLTSKKMEHEAGEEEHPPYNETTIKIAITRGLNPAGQPLDECMPRWDIDENDLNDLVEFLKELDIR